MTMFFNLKLNTQYLSLFLKKEIIKLEDKIINLIIKKLNCFIIPVTTVVVVFINYFLIIFF